MLYSSDYRSGFWNTFSDILRVSLTWAKWKMRKPMCKPRECDCWVERSLPRGDRRKGVLWQRREGRKVCRRELLCGSVRGKCWKSNGKQGHRGDWGSVTRAQRPDGRGRQEPTRGFGHRNDTWLVAHDFQEQKETQSHIDHLVAKGRKFWGLNEGRGWGVEKRGPWRRTKRLEFSSWETGWSKSKTSKHILTNASNWPFFFFCWFLCREVLADCKSCSIWNQGWYGPLCPSCSRPYNL